MNITCPCCHAKIPLESSLEGDAAGELMMLLAHAGRFGRPLISYLGLFRSKKRALSFDRAIKLANEVAELSADPSSMAFALSETVESLRQKRDSGQIKPLSNHNYLKRVLESVTSRDVEVSQKSTAIGFFSDHPMPLVPSRRRTSRIDTATELLQDWAAGDALREIISQGLLALLALPLAKSPEAAAIDKTASLWERYLRKNGLSNDDVDRIKIAFDRLLNSARDWFPVADTLIDHLPRKQREEETESECSEEENKAGMQAVKQIREMLAGSCSLETPKTVDEEERRRELDEQAQALREE